MPSHPSPAPCLHDAAALVDALQRRLQAEQQVPVERIETHLSWLLLAETLAYKIKKPLRLPFVDFTPLAVRRRCCEEELRLNRRLAPSLYLTLAEIRGSRDAPTIGGSGPLLEYAVTMRRFAAGALLSERLAAGTLEPQHIDRLADRIASFHAEAAVARDGAFGTAQGNLACALRALDGARAALADDGAGLHSWLVHEGERLAPLWQRRREEGRVREGHGDLHLANTLLDDGDVTAFDAVEFDPALRWIDVLCDIAFLVMDLAARGCGDLAARCLSRYLDAGGDHEGLPTLRFFVVYRALVRAQVGLLREEQGGAPDGPAPAAYAALATRTALQRDPRLLVTHGLPGAGKSFVSQQLLERTGAVRLRADVERKRLHGLAALDRSRHRPELDLYGREATRRTYERLLELARVALEDGWPTIVDAAFLRRAERERFAQLAHTLGVPFSILDCRAPQALLRERVVARNARGDDPSEADPAVLEMLDSHREPLCERELAQALVADAAQPTPPQALAAAWLQTRL